MRVDKKQNLFILRPTGKRSIVGTPWVQQREPANDRRTVLVLLQLDLSANTVTGQTAVQNCVACLVVSSYRIDRIRVPLHF